MIFNFSIRKQWRDCFWDFSTVKKFFLFAFYDRTMDHQKLSTSSVAVSSSSSSSSTSERRKTVAKDVLNVAEKFFFPATSTVFHLKVVEAVKDFPILAHSGMTAQHRESVRASHTSVPGSNLTTSKKLIPKKSFYRTCRSIVCWVSAHPEKN